MARSLMKATLNTLVLCTTLLAAGAASAHAHLTSQTPAADSTSAGVKDLHLNFSEGVEAKFTKVTLTDHGKAVAIKSVETDPADQKLLIVTPQAPLKAGDYNVEWHAVSVDTHKTEGHYSFKVSE